jgi:uncharacterized membrane protein
MEQPTNMPTAKVTAATAAGAVTTIVVFIADQFNLEIPALVAGALTTLLVFVAGYFKRETGPIDGGSERGYGLIEALLAVFLILVILVVLFRLL